MVSRTSFLVKIDALKGRRVFSKIRSASYADFNRSGNILKLRRVNTGKEWSIDVDVSPTAHHHTSVTEALE